MKHQLIISKQLFISDHEIEDVYPKTKSYRFKIASKSISRYLGKWRGYNLRLSSVMKQFSK